ncbi:MAG: Rha family transcriptional regulator, partial [Cetobacterium sp.]
NNIIDKIGELKFESSSFTPIESTYRTSQNKNVKCYLLPKNLFNYIVLGYEGNKKELIEFKVAYILKFEMMEELIRSMKTSIENSESANQLATEICNKLNEYENKVKEYDKRMSNISEFHKKELQMEANARFEAESKLKMYSHIINDVDTLSNGGNTIFNLPPHQEEKIINAGRRLEEIRARRNKKRYY